MQLICLISNTNLPSSERARARVRANHVKKWCVERMRKTIEWNYIECTGIKIKGDRYTSQMKYTWEYTEENYADTFYLFGTGKM